MHEITAPRNLSPGEFVFTGKPFIEILSREFKDVACGSCFKRTSNLISCESCLNVKYCDKSCQKEDRKNHDLECQNLKNLTLDDLDIADITRLLGNTILKIKDKDWKTIKSNIMGIDVSSDEIDTSLESIPATYRHIYYSSIKEYTRKYIGDENMPNEDVFRQIFGKIYNSRGKRKPNVSTTETNALAIELMLIRKECIPNCYLLAVDDGYIIKVIKNIEKSEKLSINRRNLLYSYENALSATCSCTDCSLPYGESVLTKIMDEQKALGVTIETQQFISMWRFFPGVRGMPGMEHLVDYLLRKHEGVLGNTNIWHLRLLIIKCFDTVKDPLEKTRYLLKLEKSVIAAFGEYCPDLAEIYTALSATFLFLRNTSESYRYVKKGQLLVKLIKDTTNPPWVNPL